MVIPNKVGLVIFSFNRSLSFGRLLLSIQRCAKPSSVYVIEMSDDQHEREAVAMAVEGSRNVSLYLLEQPVSWTAAMNFAVDVAREEVLAYLDDDQEVLPGWFHEQLRLMEDHQVAIVGCRYLESDGMMQKGFPVMGNNGHPVYFGQDAKIPMVCQFASMGGTFFRKSIVQAIGGFDEGYFLTHSDIDLCYRIRKGTGSIVLYNPQAELYHHKQLLRETKGPIRAKKEWIDFGRFYDRWRHLLTSEEDQLDLVRNAILGVGSPIFLRSDYRYRGENPNYDIWS
jgi:GT2 family glycosyltransferase